MMLIALLGEGNFNLEILEQPLTSIMNEHKRFSLLSWEHLETWMGMFGAPTPKTDPHLHNRLGSHHRIEKDDASTH